ncbi:MAG: LysM peptidoglycan-binding domain-containing protein, partial [Caldilineaceae bacterium]|nr:LysM peptidoglycan-binding domain-containing protein [Caldilineaceae bacterium]
YLVRNGVATLLTLDSISNSVDALQAAEENGGLGQEQTNLQPLLGAHELIEINSYLRDVEQLSAQAAGQRLSLIDYLNLQEDDVVLFCSRALAMALSAEEIAYAVTNHAADEVAEQLLSQMERRNADAKAAALLIEWKGLAPVVRRAPPRQMSRTPLYVTTAILFVGLIFVYLTFTFLRSNAEISTFSGIQALQEPTAAPSVAQRGEMPASVAQSVAPAVANADPTTTEPHDDDAVATSTAAASNVDNPSTVGASDGFTATATVEVAPTLAATATVAPPTRPPPTAEATPTATDTATLTPMPTPTLANTPTTVAAALPSSTATAPSTAAASSATATPTATPIATSSVTSSATWTATSTATLRPAATPTHTASATSTDAPTWTPLPTSTLRPTNTPRPPSTPIRGLAPTATVPSPPTVQPTATESTAALGDNVQEIYILKKDDNLWTISFERGLTVEDLLAANPQIQDRNQVLQPGMEIIIPKVTPSP